MKKKKGMVGYTLVVFLIVIAGLIYFNYLNNHAGDRKSVQASDTKESLLQYDMQEDYPKTVRETVKLHCNYLKNAYNKVFTDDELVIANDKMRQLMDEELLAINTEEAQLQGLRDEIALYEDKKQKFVSYSVAEGSQVEHNTENGVEYAKVKVTIVLKIDSKTISADEEYILRKNEEGRWKILGWQVKQDSMTTSEGEEEK